MASSYSTNYGIEEMATGDQSGTWGVTTNYNFDILDRIAAYTAVALADASTATLTVRAASPSSGSSNVQNGMYRVIKFTGTLSQNCTITIAPATTTAYFMIQNATSGGFTVIMAQGSAAQTVTVSNGKTNIAYCDGSDEVISITDNLAFGNIALSGNTVASADANGDVNIAPNGTGDVVLDTDLVKVGGGSEIGVLSSNGAYDLTLETNSGTNSSKITITDAANGNVSVIPNGTGELVVGSAAAAGKITSSGAYDLELDTNGGTNSGIIKIVDAANGNIELTPNGTGEIAVGSGAASGKISSSGAYDLELDTNAGTNSGSIVLSDGTNGNITIATHGTGAIDLSNDVVLQAQMKDYAETVSADGTKTAAFDLDISAGNVHSFTVGSGTFNVGITNALASHSNSITLIITNGGAGTVSFVAGTNAGGGNAVKWAAATAPTLTSSGVDVITLTTFDGGTNYYGFAAGLAMA
tara:strand:+ start:8298 stop:9704 length:1407 start_codon:yes stop_codon:yes gene_type:complete